LLLLLLLPLLLLSSLLLLPSLLVLLLLVVAAVLASVPLGLLLLLVLQVWLRFMVGKQAMLQLWGAGAAAGGVAGRAMVQVLRMRVCRAEMCDMAWKAKARAPSGSTWEQQDMSMAVIEEKREMKGKSDG
jgi:hypothetical protein